MRLIPLLGMALLLSGCDGDPYSPQDVMAQQTVAAGYVIDGIPVYQGGQWITNSRVQGCRASVTLAGNKAPKSKNPTSFTVVSVGGVLMTKLSPGTNTKNMSAKKLKSLDGMDTKLDCTR